MCGFAAHPFPKCVDLSKILDEKIKYVKGKKIIYVTCTPQRV